MLPPWLIFHIPHESVDIPESVRPQFCVSPTDLNVELQVMTDHHTFELFCGDVEPSQVVRAEVSRLVIDMERFSEDADESMASSGMGMVYERTHDGKALRHPLNAAQRQAQSLALKQAWYEPHHARLNRLTQKCLEKHGKCLVVDGHSFASQALPYEQCKESRRPQICIGTHELHTPVWLLDRLEDGFWQQSFSVGVNDPFAGCMVPSEFHGKDPRVMCVMIEVRKDVYMDERNGEKNKGFERVAQSIRTVLTSLAD